MVAERTKLATSHGGGGGVGGRLGGGRGLGGSRGLGGVGRGVDVVDPVVVVGDGVVGGGGGAGRGLGAERLAVERPAVGPLLRGTAAVGRPAQVAEEVEDVGLDDGAREAVVLGRGR